MAVGYRAILRLDDTASAIDVADDELHKWITSKVKGRHGGTMTREEWSAEGHHVLSPKAEVSVTRSFDETSGSRLQLIRFVDRNPQGVWTVSIYALEQPEAALYRQTLVVDVDIEGAPDDEAVDRVRPPRLVRQLLENAVVRDGSTRLYAHPRIVEIQDVPEVFQAIKDPARTASVIIAPSLGDGAMQEWTKVLEQLTKDSVGVATVFILTAEARERLEPLLPDSHAVERGNIRTFAPGVDLESPADGASHRYLGATALARSLIGLKVRESLQIQHARDARRRFLELALPDDVETAFRILSREEARVLRTARVEERLRISRASAGLNAEPKAGIAAPAAPPAPNQAEPVSPAVVAPEPVVNSAPTAASPKTDPERPTPSPAASALLRKLTSMVGRWLKKPKFHPSDLDALDEYIETQEAYQNAVYEENEVLRGRSEALEADLKATRAYSDDLEFELKASDEATEAATRDAQSLRQRLLDLEAFEAAFAPAEESEVWKAPANMTELLDRLDAGSAEGAHPVTTNIMFSGSITDALKIDRHDGLGRHATNLWKYLHVLHDFAEFRKSGRFVGSVHQYLSDDRSPQGTKCSLDKHAFTESEGVLTNAKLRSERVLPAPTPTDGDRTLLMAAHFKPTKNDGFAPRLHYVDDIDATGLIYVGYIGPHLTLPRKY